MSRDLARELFNSFKAEKSKKAFFKRALKIEDTQSEVRNQEPELIKDLLEDLVRDRSWHQPLAEGNLFALWGEIVGEEIGTHSQPITFLDGRLTIRASSSAWATQLKLLSPSLLEKISSTAPGVLVEELLIIGPEAPSWKKGLRSIKGAKGPRDTYG